MSWRRPRPSPGAGDLLHTVAALDTADGSVVGFSELVVPGDGKGDGQHYGTAVLPEHRGHGLGRWMKAESIRRAHRHHPGLTGLLTDTATGNAPMLAHQRRAGIRAHAPGGGVPARAVRQAPPGDPAAPGQDSYAYTYGVVVVSGSKPRRSRTGLLWWEASTWR